MPGRNVLLEWRNRSYNVEISATAQYEQAGEEKAVVFHVRVELFFEPHSVVPRRTVMAGLHPGREYGNRGWVRKQKSRTESEAH